MNRFVVLLGIAPLCLPATSLAQSQQAPPADAAPTAARVYGEWRIQIRPDRGAEYNRLIERQGLPLFRKAGGRMVGWWTTLVGDLYEHVTIWEYDDMPAFERAIGVLSGDADFARFVAARDPLLAGERNRFLKLAPGAQPPRLPESAPLVVHERHRVRLKNRQKYLATFTGDVQGMLKRHGFRPVGPFIVAVGDWEEATWLFCFESLTEREQLIERFEKHDDAKIYGRQLAELTDGVTTQLLVPAPFAKPAAAPAKAAPNERSSLLPHLEQLAPGVFAAGFADRFGSANCGWAATAEGIALVDLPRGVAAGEYLKEVARISGASPQELFLTRWQPGDEAIVERLIAEGVSRIRTSPAIAKNAAAASSQIGAALVKPSSEASPGPQASQAATLISLDGSAAAECAAVYLPEARVLFAGPAVVHGPRADLTNSHTAEWLEALDRLDRFGAAHVVPGFGSWGGGERLARQRRFLGELRQQVAYAVAQGKPSSALAGEVRLSVRDFSWMPYDAPTPADLEHVYRELTVPAAPFNGRLPQPGGRPHALALIGDGPHEPAHLEAGLRPAFEAAGITPHFTVDVRALSAENLSRVQLLVILRDGLQRPGGENSQYQWMTAEQQQAVVDFVQRGGGFLNLHNSIGLYPDDGAYLKLVGGRYIGHGPLERFRVEVVDREHPITRGVENFSVADEQHTPPYDAEKVHLLLQNRSDDGKVAAAGWAYEPGRGRLCHLANGHTSEALLHPMYQRLLGNAMIWLTFRDGPSEKNR